MLILTHPFDKYINRLVQSAVTVTLRNLSGTENNYIHGKNDGRIMCALGVVLYVLCCYIFVLCVCSETCDIRPPLLSL